MHTQFWPESWYSQVCSAGVKGVYVDYLLILKGSFWDARLYFILLTMDWNVLKLLLNELTDEPTSWAKRSPGFWRACWNQCCRPLSAARDPCTSKMRSSDEFEEWKHVWSSVWETNPTIWAPQMSWRRTEEMKGPAAEPPPGSCSGPESDGSVCSEETVQLAPLCRLL